MSCSLYGCSVIPFVNEAANSCKQVMAVKKIRKTSPDGKVPKAEVGSLDKRV